MSHGSKFLLGLELELGGSLTHLRCLNFALCCSRYHSDGLKWRAEEKRQKRARRKSQDQGIFSLVSP